MSTLLKTGLGKLGVKLGRLVAKTDLERSAAAVGGLMRRVGPRLKGHRVAREQIAIAFPEKSEAEREAILLGMWDNFGRLFAEYAHLEQLWDYDFARPNTGRVTIDPVSAERLAGFVAHRKPTMVFTAHYGNWELLPPCVTVSGRAMSVVFRAPRIGPLVEEVIRLRSTLGSSVIAAGPEAPLRVRDALRGGEVVGMLADQHAVKGTEVTFFGRRCMVNSMFGRFVRRFDCEVYGGRAVRLPGERFRLECVGPLDLPRDQDGKVDVAAAMQCVTGIVEGWVREHPEQWLWLHRRWR